MAKQSIIHQNLTMNDKETIKFMLSDIQKRFSRLNEWEQNFIADIEERFLSGRDLTVAQDKKLDQIYEKATENG